MGVRYSPKIVSDSSLVLYLDAASSKSYAGSGTTWTDLSGNGNAGALSSGATFNSANLGNISVDGTVNGYVSIPNAASINPTSAITVSAWFNISSFTNNYAPIVFKQNTFNSNYEQYSLSLGSGGSGFTITDPSQVQRSAVTAVDYRNQITCAVGTCDITAQKLNFYINGILIQTTSFPSTFNISTNQLSIGATTGGAASSYPGKSIGKIFNVSIYNRALSATEVLQNYNATKGRFGLT
jgi:hypothetical protein